MFCKFGLVLKDNNTQTHNIMQTTLKRKYDAPQTDVVWVRMETGILGASESNVSGTRQGYGTVYSMDED